MRLLKDKLLLICILVSLAWHLLSIAVFSTVFPVKIRSEFKPEENPVIDYFAFAPDNIEARLNKLPAIPDIDLKNPVDVFISRLEHDIPLPKVDLPESSNPEAASLRGEKKADPVLLKTETPVGLPSSDILSKKPKSNLSADMPQTGMLDDEDVPLDMDLSLNSKLGEDDGDGMLSVSGDVSKRKVVSKPGRLDLPDWVEEKGKEYTCRIEFWVTKDGMVSQTKVLQTSGDSRIDIYGENLIKQFIFERSKKETEAGELDFEIRLRPDAPPKKDNKE